MDISNRKTKEYLKDDEWWYFYKSLNLFRITAEIVAINDKGESAPFQVELDTPQPDNIQETSYDHRDFFFRKCVISI